ncbi:LCP family glycopolymer transferase [Tuberibacillus sp. Marseille-P3662]|uniref:LCP family glycopolymer transferase n=1 Tax=Tuberibacillus sp. Marseille-P3662 TaxID=1965358 RepID=UPI000A1C98CD|nr:LCP family protein [Tuberibacillus sp. Marseille-P3662]
MKKFWIILGSIIGVLVIGTSVYAYNVYSSVKDTAQKMHEPVDQSEEKQPKKSLQENNKDQEANTISILLMGVDERKNDKGRSDALMVMTLNPKKETMQMVSIPRDTRTKIVGHGTVDKINHAYAFGGTKMSMDTVENFLNINLDYYIKMNMEGLVDLVDAVGGITLYNDDSWHDPGYYKKGYFYHEGDLNLNGDQAIGYVRMRYLEGGDFTRNEHQREVIQAVIKKAASFSSFTHYKDILSAISNNVKTNLTFDDMKYIAMNDKKAKNNIKTYEVKGNGKMIDGTYYLSVSDAEVEKVHGMIEEQLSNSE